MFVAASFKHETENLVPARITCAAATAPDVRRKVSFPLSGSWCGCRADVTVDIISLAPCLAQQPSTGRVQDQLGLLLAPGMWVRQSQPWVSSASPEPMLIDRKIQNFMFSWEADSM